jgi:diguanylate cyclase (GGDEF)-like protein
MSIARRSFSLRTKLAAAFFAVSLLITGFVIFSIHTQFETYERAARLEAEHIANALAYTGADDSARLPTLLQERADRLNELYKRDVVVVGLDKKGIADVDRSEVGALYTGDPDNEVGRTMKDGQVRTFVEKNEHHSAGAMQIVVPLRVNQARSDSPIIGAVILEYTGIYDSLLAAEPEDLYLSGIAGILCIVLSTLFGFHVAKRIAQPIRELERNVDSLAGGNYDAKVAVETQDEIGRLGGAFNKMAADLRLSHATLLEHQRSLEDRVAERTRELDQSNALLVQEARERIQAAERIEYLAFYDSLTGLPNRAMFSKLLDQGITMARRYNRRLAVLFVDLDRFKLINDTLGHAAGDELLKEVANRLKDCLRKSDAVARLGGDEFVLLLPELEDEKHAIAVAHKIVAAIAKPFTVHDQEFRITASIGISTCPKDGTDERSLMKNADLAMYHAKEEGKNTFKFFSEQLNTASFERMALESSLRRALGRNEFELYYQPRIDLQTNLITGMEALLRWHHPDLGMVPPTKFIPVAEESGLIVEIGKWVLETACLQSQAWQKAGMPALSMAVNLSARQFADDNLLADVTETIQKTGMDPSQLELEITESMLMHNVGKAMKVLTALREMGIRLAIDDFGTGYSSLATLKQFPVHTIKVDRTFIRDLPNNTEDQGLTEAIIALGRTLSLNVIAEGVETKEQADFLRERACNEVQGFYFSKPVPSDQFAGLLRAQSITPHDGIGAEPQPALA